MNVGSQAYMSSLDKNALLKIQSQGLLDMLNSTEHGYLYKA